jgi:dCTP deaminase
MHSHGLRIENLAEGAIGPCSIDLTLSHHFRRFDDHSLLGPPSIDPRIDQGTDGKSVEIPDGDFFTLGSHEFCLASCRERFTFPAHLAGRLEGKSSLGRLGLAVHTTAGFFDSGFVGYPTLELFNCRRRPIRLYPGMPIAQMSIFEMTSAAAVPYGANTHSKYADQGPAPVPSRYHLNWNGRGWT